MQNPIPQITVDTTVVTDWTRPITRYLKKRLDASKRLLDWHQARQVALWYCPGVLEPGDSESMIQLAAQVSLGQWKNGVSHAHTPDDQQVEATIWRILELNFLPDHRHSIDGVLLLEHYQQRREVFVSGDRKLLHASPELSAALGIRVMSPLETVAYLQAQVIPVI